MTTIDLTVYNALVNDDGSNTVGTLATKVALLLNPVLTPVQTAVTALDAVDALKAPLASPTFTGVPAAPTASVGTNTTQLATTAFVAANAPAFPGTSNPTTTGTSTALAIPTGTGNLAIFMNNATLLTVQGIAAGLDGQLLTIYSKGAGQIDFAHAHASGTALGKLNLFATTGLTSLAAGSGVAVFQYDLTLTKWRLAAHEQGAWITPTFAAGNFTGDGSMTWTLAAGDVTQCRYRLSGRTLAVSFVFVTTTVGGTPATGLRVNNGAWGGFTISGVQYLVPNVYSDNGGALTAGYLQAGSALGGSTWYACYKAAGANWSAATDTTAVYGTIQFEVT